jgi:hypothetical protein
MTTPVRPRALILKLAVLLAALALLGAACSSDDSGSDGETSTDAGEEEEATEEATEEAADDAAEEAAEEPTEEAAEEATEEAAEESSEDMELTASFTGVTEDTISVGITMLDFPGMVSSGLSTQGWGDQELVWQTFVDDLNARGGINGRMVEPNYQFYSPIGTAEAEAACVALTDDTETFAVLGGFLGPSELANTCIPGLGETILVGGRMSDERLEQSVAPWIQAPAMSERKLDIFLELLDNDDRIAGRTITVVGSVEREDVANAAVEQLEALGAGEVNFINNDIDQGDIQGNNDAWAIYAERIAADGSEVVFAVGSGQAAVRGISANGLDVEVWVLDEDSLNNLGAATATADADGAITVSGLTDQEQFEDDSIAPCIDVFSAANPEIEVVAPDAVEEGEEHWFNSVINYCMWLSLFEVVATEAGADLTQDSFWNAIETIGEIQIPGHPFASLAAEKYDASDSFRLTQFDSTIGDKGQLQPLTDIQNVTG